MPSRFDNIRCVMATLIGAVFVLTFVRNAHASDWPQFMHDASDAKACGGCHPLFALWHSGGVTGAVNEHGATTFHLQNRASCAPSARHC